MKYLKRQFYLPIFCAILLSFASGCNSSEEGKWKNNKISEGKREDFHELNRQLFEAIRSNNTNQLELLLSGPFLESLGGRSNRFLELLHLQTKNLDFKLKDEYYIKYWLKVPFIDTIQENNKGINSYNINFPVSGKENYIVFYEAKEKAPEMDNWLLTITYSKYAYGWKLNKVDLSRYTINGKTAPELFKVAKQKYSIAYVTDAINDMALASEIFNPGGIIHYENEDEMRTFYNEAKQEFERNYSYPIVLSQIATKPKIFRVMAERKNGGTFPAIYYQTSVKMSDTAALKRENNQIKSIIGKVFLGIDKNKKYLFYTAYDKMPGGKQELKSYSFIDKH